MAFISQPPKPHLAHLVNPSEWQDGVSYGLTTDWRVGDVGIGVGENS